MVKYLSNIRRYFRKIFSERAIIPWMMAAAIIPIMLVSFFAYFIAKDILNHAINSILLTEIQKKIEFIDHYITERKLDIAQVSELPVLISIVKKLEANNQPMDKSQDETVQSFTNYLNHLASKMGLLNIYIINVEGKVLFSMNKDPITGQLISAAQPDHANLYKAFDGARILQMPYLFNEDKISGSTDQLRIYLSNPITVNNRMSGVLIMRLDLFAIEQMINRLFGYNKSEETLLATIINNEPTVIMRTKKGGETPTKITKNSQILQLLEKAIRGESGKPTVLIENDKPMLAVYRYVPQLNMGMLMQYDKKEIFQRIRWLKISILTLTSISLILVAAIVFWISRALWKANIKSELLLENILPKFVIDELKEKKQFIARNISDVSIIFVDIISYTSYASTMPPGKVVSVLDDIFSIFDQLSEQYKLEKIKTIGDAYMAVAGLTAVQVDHANRAVDVGLAMILAVKHYNIDHHTNFAVRVGIDSGTVTAGIIGKKKFSYDLWGNAVNRASRMESTGIENKVQITHDTYVALQNKEQYVIDSRKEVMVKGLGKMDTYIIEEKSV